MSLRVDERIRIARIDRIARCRLSQSRHSSNIRPMERMNCGIAIPRRTPALQ
jgi:hypothetical protein